MRFLLPALLLCLTGCFLDREEKPVVQNNTPAGVIVEDDLPTKLDAVKNDIVSSNNSTQNKMEGLITASVSKLGEKVTGLETNVGKIVGFETKLDSLVKLQAEFSSTIRDVNNKLQVNASANIEAFKDLNLKLAANVEASLRLQAELRAEMSNVLEINRKMESRIETLNASAGRDVMTNYFPKEAVDAMQNQGKVFVAIIAALCGLASTVITLLARNARIRAELRTKMEREEKQEMAGILKQLLLKSNE